ncbi:hypothetical protein BsWGS_15240 [Bradybaena similaris]
MHRTISVKYRIVRRVDIDKAPLATFDTVDLGDEDVQVASGKSSTTETTVAAKENEHSCQVTENTQPELFIYDGILKSETIGASSSKKSLTQVGGEEREARDDRTKDKVGCVVEENVQASYRGPSPVPESLSTEARQAEVQNTESIFSDRERSVDNSVLGCTVVPPLTGHGTIGRVHVPIRKQDSDSSSSSPSSCNDAAFTFQASESSACQFDRTAGDGQVADIDAKKDSVDNLVPEYLDPSQILSPSKRKAYERRIERLKVTTSPIARPRSTTPINVVTLDEYAAINSPETTPATTFIVQDKLKITLPTDEFASKPKTPKLPNAKKNNVEDTCFEFTEEFLFSRTKAALVVADDGHLPLSPRRVLIPPNLTPTTSPKLSASPKLTPDSFYEDLTPDAPYLKEIQEIEATRKFFGTTVDENEEDNWADFHDISQTDEDNDTSTSTVCDANEENEIRGSSLLDDDWTTPAKVGHNLFAERIPLESASQFAESVSLGSASQFAESVPLGSTNLFAESIPYQAASGQLDVLEEFLVYQPDDDLYDEAQIASSHPDHTVTFESASKFSEIFHDSILDCDTDLPHSGYSRPFNSTLIPAVAPEVSHFAVDSDLESEEIITIEINQSTGGREKLIGIEIRSTGNSASVSPVCCDWSTGQRSPHSDTFRAASEASSGVQRGPGVFSPANGDSNSPVLNGERYRCSPSDTCAWKNYLDGDKSPLDTDVSFVQVHETQRCTSSPIFDPPPASSLYTTPSDLPNQLPHHQHSLPDLGHQQPPLHPPLLRDEATSLPQRPPSTNPFDIDYEAPGSNPFDLGLQRQNPCTNPFLENPSSTSTDLMNFVFTSDTSSA